MAGPAVWRKQPRLVSGGSLRDGPATLAVQKLSTHMPEAVSAALKSTTSNRLRELVVLTIGLVGHSY